jgi:methyl-accepting chemotaxis protein
MSLALPGAGRVTVADPRRQCFASEESFMSRLAELGIAKRIALMVVAAVIALAALAVISMLGQHQLAQQAENTRKLEAGLAALNHLDTRQSELKVDAYRAALGQDVAADVTDDVQSSTEAADAVVAAGLPAKMAATFAGDRPDFVAFSQFITDFAKDAATSTGLVRPRLGEIAERNHATDDELGTLTDQVTAAVVRERADLTSAVSRTRLLALAVAIVGLALIVLLAVPLARSILRPVRRLGGVLDAVALGDLTQRSGITSRDELGRMASALDRVLEAIRSSMTTIGANAATLASSATELSAVASQIAESAHDTDAPGQRLHDLASVVKSSRIPAAA